MPYENTAGLGVHNQYGPRTTGGVKGYEPGSGVERKHVTFFDSTVPLDDQVPIWAGSIVTGVTKPANVTAVNVGAVNVTAATEVAPVEIAVTAVPTFTGAVTGDIIIIKYIHVAGDIDLT